MNIITINEATVNWLVIYNCISLKFSSRILVQNVFRDAESLDDRNQLFIESRFIDIAIG